MKIEFLKIQALDDFLKIVQNEKQKLFEELLQNANNQVIRNRRVRMLSQLSQYESSTIKKIVNFQTDNYLDYFKKDYRQEILAIVNRSS
jgi:vacuolar-type H+-ATPase subunit E/Vma4